jgi:cell division septation protein DedD
MRILSFSLLTALTNAAADVQHNPSLRGRIDSNGEEADWFHRMAQDIGSMVPTQAPVVSPPGPGFTTAPVATPPPTMDPTPPPTKAPTNAETKSPTKAPTKSPTKAPTKSPTKEPTKSPTNNPLTSAPTVSLSPTALASDGPSSVPTIAVSLSPTALASDGPSSVPTITSFDLDFVQDESDGDFFFDVCQGGTNALDHGKSFITPYSDLPFSSSS